METAGIPVGGIDPSQAVNIHNVVKFRHAHILRAGFEPVITVSQLSDVLQLLDNSGHCSNVPKTQLLIASNFAANAIIDSPCPI